MKLAWFLVLSILWFPTACRKRSSGTAAQVKDGETPAPGEEGWENVGAGILYKVFTSETPNRMHVAKIDLTHPQVAVMATRTGDKKNVVSKFAGDYKCSIAINADLFNQSFTPLGLTIGGGEVWPGTKDNDRSGFVAFGLDNKVAFSSGAELKEPEAWMYAAASGFPVMVKDGKHGDLTCRCNKAYYEGRHPRTAIGASADGKTLFMTVVDGRSEKSKGMTIRELADFMLSLGAHTAMNFDGGGSSTMFILKKDGVVNSPSDGRERVVASHLGICKGKAEDIAALHKVRPDFAPPDDEYFPVVTRNPRWPDFRDEGSVPGKL